jgi:arginase
MIPVIGLASGLGGRHDGSRLGPQLIQEHLSAEVNWKKIIRPTSNPLNKRQEIPLLNEELANEVHACVREYPFTMIIGGDHSCGIGTWSGVSEALRQKEEDLAVIWMDAHMDSHTHETTPSGNIHGMPLASLLGYGSTDLTQLFSQQIKLKPENVFLVGIRSYEEAERALLEKLKVRVYYMDEVQQRGLQTIFNEIIENLSTRKLSYGISLDIDFFDGQIMSATGTPEDNGVDPLEFIDSYSAFEKYPPIAFEYVEFNPPQDKGNQSLDWSLRILKHVIQTSLLVQKEELVKA